MSSNWSSLQPAPVSIIFQLDARHKQDESPNKINCGIGAYRTEEGTPYYFSAVRKAEQIILTDPNANKEYSPIAGYPPFIEATRNFLFGENSNVLREKRVATVQGLSGTGSLTVGAFLLHKTNPNSTVYVSNITWENHVSIFGIAGYPRSQIKTYEYYDPNTISINFDLYKRDLLNAPEQSIFVFHTCAHNPTGVDPSKEQWKEILDICVGRKLIPFFDTAYQGFATGDLDDDVYPVRLFADHHIEFLVSQSYAKNMGLYSERIGALNVVCKSGEVVGPVKGLLEYIIRSLVSNCPSHGARIVSLILTNKELFNEWKSELSNVVSRIINIRKALRDKLVENKCPGNWDHIVKQNGMFSFTGLDVDQSKRMVDKHHIYMAPSGRISVPGLNNKNVQYMADCIKEVVEWKINGKK